MKILYIMYRFPFPLDRGDKLRAFNQIKYLSQKHDIYLCSILDEPLNANNRKYLEPYCKEIFTFSISKVELIKNLFFHFISNRPLQNAFVYLPKFKKSIAKIVEDYGINHSITLMLRPAEYSTELPIPNTLDYQDVLSKGFDRRSKKFSFPRNLFYKLEANRLSKYEEKLFDLFDNKIIITEEDRNYIPHCKRNEIQIISNGIDLNYFVPQPIEKKYDVVFVGNMGYEPNILGMKYLAGGILPIVKQVKPNIKILIAGADPVDSVLSLKSDSIDISGRLDDIRVAYSLGKMFVAPLLIGTGLQNKLLESMAMKLPVITSPLCNRALNAQHLKEIIVANSSKEYAEYIVKLLENIELANTIATNGYNFVKNKYSWEQVNSKLEKILTGN